MPSIKNSILCLAFSTIVFVVPACANQSQFIERSVTSGNATYKYRVYVPTKKNDSPPPIMLFLHGAGERGDDNLAQTQVGLGPAILQQKDFPFVVVLPQCPRGRWWSEPDMQAQALRALEQSLVEFRADQNRIYLTGLSMGGYGLWVIAAANPGKFAALAPVCGGIRPPRPIPVQPGTLDMNSMENPYAFVAQKIGKTPVWVFHGSADPSVPVTESQKMVEALKSVGGNVKYTEYEGVGHNSWDKAYSDSELYKWMLSHTLGKTAKARIPESRRLRVKA
jgi:predicted peptidase